MRPAVLRTLNVLPGVCRVENKMLQILPCLQGGFYFTITKSRLVFNDTKEPSPCVSLDSAKIIQGTIAATAVIYEIIAVITSKQAFKWAGELHKQQSDSA